MELFEWLGTFSKQHSLEGLLLTLFILNHLGLLDKWKPRKEENLSLELDHKIDSVNRMAMLAHSEHQEIKERVDKMEIAIGNHLEKEALEDIRLAKMESEQDHFRESVVEFKENQKAIFSMISEVKNMLIAGKG